MKIFAEGELGDYLRQILSTIEIEVRQEPRNQILNVNETEFVDYLVNKHSLEAIIFYWDHLSVSDREDMIPAEYFPGDFHVYEGKRYPKQVITYHLPFSGTYPLLSLIPSSRILWTTEVKASPPSIAHPGTVSFEIINWRNDAETIKREADRILENIRKQAENSANQVAGYNRDLEQQVTRIFQARKQQMLKESNLLANLGVPFKKSENIPATFAVPTRQKAIRIDKPIANNVPFAPEPTLDSSIYREILTICHTTGIEMERHPAIYEDKSEEALRDHFIMVLAPHFESVTGETFNRSGKTDILIRHESKNVFVAECKFWKGQKVHLKTIDQILGYLTWRDSKAAILYFVRNKNLDPVLKSIEDGTSEHPCFVKYRGRDSEGWFSYHFHLSKNNPRGLELAILCFHFP